jgi:hypothetical protein
MKKQTILFLAGGLLALASCGNNNNASQENAQAKVESMKNVMDMQQKEQAMKDSMAAVMTAQKAKTDSMEAAMKAEQEHKGGKAEHKGHEGTAKTAPQPSAPPPPPPASTQDNKFNNRAGNTQSKTSAADQQTQDSKFNNRGK